MRMSPPANLAMQPTTDRLGEASLPPRTATYLLPIRRHPGSGPPPAELTTYLADVARRHPLVIVDGSDERTFNDAHSVWSGFACHVRPDADLACRNGKVHGVLTGLRRATTDRVVIADDDVRYDAAALDRAVALLEHHEVVVPQNFFDPLPWHAVWDTARTLVNRAIGHDYAGTVALRRSRIDGYDGDVLFENLELIRTVEAAGGRKIAPLDLYVRRLPPTTTHFFSQRVRQAYDDFARPSRLAVSLTLLPAVLLAPAGKRLARAGALSALFVIIAERGRRRQGGRAVFPARASLLAPLWVAERSLCSWIALWLRLRGGCPYAGGRLRRAATSRRALNQRLG
jgi:hypothetical protein